MAGRWQAASGDGTVRVWSATGVGAPLVLAGHADRVRSVTFSPDGERLLSAGGDGAARLWSVEGAGPVLVLPGGGGSVESAEFSADGRSVVTASRHGTVRVWAVSRPAPETDLVEGSGEVTMPTSDVAPLASLWLSPAPCLTVERRMELLAQSSGDAEQGLARCQAMTACVRAGGAEAFDGCQLDYRRSLSTDD